MTAAMQVAHTLQESIAVTVELAKRHLGPAAQIETINKRLTAEELVATSPTSRKTIN